MAYRPKAALDLHKLTEEDRIRMIGRSVINPTRMNAFVVEDDAKADRYIAKLKAMFPEIRVIDRQPFADFISVRVAGPLQG
jgi:hypothetical protein